MAMDHTGTSMSTGAHGAGSQGAAAQGAGSHLGRLNDLDEFKVADGYPDPRGWHVKTADGQTVGKVDDLIVDTEAMRVRYVSVEVDRSVGQLAQDAATPGDQGTHTLLPIGSVELDDASDDVLVNGYSLQQVAGLPRYAGGSGASISRDYETSLVDRHRGRSGVGGALASAGAAVAAGAHHVKDAVTPDRYEHEDYDDQRPFARRRQGAAGEQRLTLAEEQLSVGKRQAAAGEVELHKTVETERVTEQVQLRHDEVSVERRPVTDASSVSGQTQIGEDEIRIPIMEEKVVMQKVLVPREEIIVRKNQVTDTQTVSADVRRERLDTSDLEAQQRQLQQGHGAGAASGLSGGSMSGGSMSGGSMSGAQDRATDSGLLDRAADKLDDLKDRVDGNPASRPGPDATDRRI
jgi:uncharacterized protein (TIGR02271 family)